MSSSAKLCASLGVKDIDLEWSDADYQNLTTLSIFSRMVRPQLAAINSKIPAAKMNTIMEAKWKEFQESNPYNKPSRSRAAAAAAAAASSSEEEDDGQAIVEQHDSSEDASERMDSVASQDDDDDNDDDDSTSNSQPRKMTSRMTSDLRLRVSMASFKKRSSKKTADSAEESISDDDSVEKKRKRKRHNSDSEDYETPVRQKTSKRLKAAPPPVVASDEDEALSSQQASATEDDDDSDSPRGKKKKGKGKPVIPGERKSNRSRRSQVSMHEMTDKEFEQMLIEQDKEKEKSNRRKSNREKGEKEEKGKTDSAKKGKQAEMNEEMKKKSKRINKPSEPKEKPEGESGNESDHLWYCELCKDGGDLLLCDTCPKSFHKECLKLEIVPDGDWSCPVCTGEGLPEKGDTSDEGEVDTHEAYCHFCKDVGDVMLCDFCPLVFHMHCVYPPLKALPDGEWKCPICVVRETPLKGKIKQILTWRWSQQPTDADELDHTHVKDQKDGGNSSTAFEIKPTKKNPRKPEREVFVKYEFHSYWDCDWVSETALEVHQPLMHQSYKRKFDMNEPPALEDGSSFGKPRHKASNAEDDKFNLEERYYRYGIKPDWLQIHRILTHDGKGKERRFLVKWRDVPYSECTWEFPEDIPDGLEGFEKHVDDYWALRRIKMKDEKESKKAELPKKSLLRKKLEKQPSYVDETGGTLHPYQLEGLNWLRFSWSQDTNTILADEMGLGKTIQAITFCYSLFREGFITKPVLISAPLSTVPNWEREFEFWAPDMYVVTYTGGKENRIVIRERDFCFKDGCFYNTAKPCRLREGFRPKFDVLLTSYEFVSADFATLSSLDWSLLVIDEAHRLKNNQSLWVCATTLSMRTNAGDFKSRAYLFLAHDIIVDQSGRVFENTINDFKIGYTLLLTGTPLQNNLEELFNLLNFLEPNKFVNMDEFLSEFSEISKDEQVMKLHDMLAPHMLRRMKMDVLKDIPSKSEFIVRIELSEMQKKFYKHILTKNYEALNAKGYSNQTSLINIMMDLRKCCNHPYLFPGAEKDAPLTARGTFEGNAMIKASGKFEMLEKMLTILKRDGHRVLIFSQMTRMLDIMEDFLVWHGYGYERIDGSIAGSKRQESIDRFNSPECPNFVFLLSTRAGGLGVNLATADTVIIFDMDWNPHNDIQAFSRAHRIGQKNQVMIYRFVCRNTVEEKIAQVCKQKMMLSELIVHRGMGSGANVEKKDSLTKQEISDILKYGAENLFKDDEEGQVVYSNEDVEKLLDRNQVAEEETKDKEMGMNEYLRSFKVASYQVKEDSVAAADSAEDEEEEKEEEGDDDKSKDNAGGVMETDMEYWQRVLGSAYNEHVVATLREQEEVAKTLGKGKRVRKQINYAEKEMMEALSEGTKRKKAAQEEDVAFQSDYEPSSSDDEEGDDVPEDENGEKKPKAAKPNKPPPKQQQVSLPALVERTADGQILVLGFTARQRRAFLDAVMRYGMPPSDPYRSQWLVRDLRSKPERVFKAFVSLFMRHLCEPLAENADKFADGVPREGLSRQHVLTRIGIIALIRKKVHEFEDVNGTNSMLEFRKPVDTTATVITITDEASADKDKDNDDKNTDNGDKDKADKSVDNGKDKEETDGDKTTDDKTTEDKEDGKESEEKVKSEKDAVKDVDADKEKDSGKTAEDTEEAKKEEEEKKTDEVKENDESKMETDNEKEEKSEDKSEKETDKVEKSSDKDKKEEEKSAEESMDTSEAGDKSKDEKASTSEEKSAEDKEESAEKKNKEGEESMDVDKTKEDSDKSSAADTAENTAEGEVKSGEEKDSEDKAADKSSDAAKPAASKDGSSSQLLTSTMTAAEISEVLRKRFWVADGGFTELHSLWQMEESQLLKGREFETWHRRHDFWLLAGVVTHGYRHWQDILSDPRFDLMNQAFRTDSERTRKAAFLNRRFQLLEQALVVEEQLRKSAAEGGAETENAAAATAAANSDEAAATAAPAAEEKKAKPSRTDHLQALDELATNLKKIGQDPNKTRNSKMNKVYSQITALVNDINDMSYTNMPASLAKGYQPKTTNVVPVPRQQVQMKPVMPSGVQWSSYRQPGAPAGNRPMFTHHQQQQPQFHGYQGGSQGQQRPTTGDKAKNDVICID